MHAGIQAETHPAGSPAAVGGVWSGEGDHMAGHLLGRTGAGQDVPGQIYREPLPASGEADEPPGLHRMVGVQGVSDPAEKRLHRLPLPRQHCMAGHEEELSGGMAGGSGV